MPQNKTLRQLVLTSAVIAIAVASFSDAFAAPAKGPRRRKLALLVGVKEYDHAQLTRLQYSENDVVELAGILREQNFQVVLMTTAAAAKNPDMNPTAENIQRELAKLLKKVTRRDLVVVGLAGHGIQPLGSDSAYFCPRDGNPTTKADADAKGPNKAAFPETLISIDETLETLGNSGVGQTIMLMDACRNDPGVRGRRGVDRVRVQTLPAETVVLLSCSPGQFAFEHKSWGNGGHGAFFSQVIEGLRGAAADETGRVTWDDLARHLRKKVPALVRAAYGKDGGEQRPNIIANVSSDPIPLTFIASRKREVARKVDKVAFTTPPGQRSASASFTEGNVADPNLGLKLRLIPAGTFWMGSPDSEGGHTSSERRHQVRITHPFYMGKYEVTRGQFRRFINETHYKTDAERSGRGGSAYNADEKKIVGPRLGYTWLNRGFDQDDSHPVVNVSWNDAVQFCKWLSKKEGATYRLPTEAEWEYACRAGSDLRFCNGDDPETLTTYGNVRDQAAHLPFPKLQSTSTDDGYAFTAPVGQFQPNAFGLHDMHGNVWELCSDWFDEKAYESGSPTDPQGPHAGSARVIRGGGFLNTPDFCRSAKRSRYSPTQCGCAVGFRVVRVK